MSSAHIQDGRDFFELLERAVALAGPRVNQRQIGDQGWTIERVLGNRQELDRRRASRIASSFRPSPASSIATPAK